MNFQQLRRIVWTFNVPLGDGEGGFNVMFHCNIVSKVDDTVGEFQHLITLSLKIVV
jgi:hypothetical protein